MLITDTPVVVLDLEHPCLGLKNKIFAVDLGLLWGAHPLSRTLSWQGLNTVKLHVAYNSTWVSMPSVLTTGPTVTQNLPLLSQ